MKAKPLVPMAWLSSFLPFNKWDLLLHFNIKISQNSDSKQVPFRFVVYDIIIPQKRGEKVSKPRGRHELKHHINYADVLQLRAKLPFIAKLDVNGAKENGYRVRSLYFDNYQDKALKEKLDGVSNREKFRLRFYNGKTDYIRLEKKSKKKGICFKESSTVTEEQCRCLLAGDLAALKENGSPLCLELYTKMYYQQLRAKNIVDYWRAYVYPPGNVRITLDYDLRADYMINNFLKPEAASIPISGIYLLEVKYDCFLPEIIRNLVSLSSRRSTAFSKYAVTRII